MIRVLTAGLLTLAAGPAYDPGPNAAGEPLAPAYSADNAARFLDHVGPKWTADRKCGACHTNVPMLWARTAGDAAKTVRSFFEARVTHWDRGTKGDTPRWDTEVVVTAVTLAVHDARTSGRMHPTTEAALARMWKVQTLAGRWNWLKCNWPPQEHDDEFGAVFAAVGVGHAPGGYAKSEAARPGLDRLRAYLAKTPMPSLHHEAWKLWASARVEGLMTAEQRAKTVAAIRKLQKPDGGWSLPSLGDWEPYDGRDNDPDAASDGYGTGLMVLVLREAGVAKDDPAVAKGAAWLRTHQRASGRWWTRSLNTDKAHYITNAGTAYALMALEACR